MNSAANLTAPTPKPSPRWRPWVLYGLYALATLSLLTAFVPVYPANVWWIRMWDFPRLQLTVVYLFLAGLLALFWRTGWLPRVFAGALLAAAAYQLWWIAPYLAPAPNETQAAQSEDPRRRIRLMTANVLQDNRDWQPFLKLVRDVKPDVLIVVEIDDWWAARLQPLKAEFAHATVYPLGNTYGIAFYSNLPVERAEVRFFVEPDIPSVDAVITMPSGEALRLFAVHPTPPMPGEDTVERDAELVLVGREAKEHPGPTVVLGDLNDVAWSPTTQLFQKESRLLDPRKGRGLYPTFPAGYPPLRYPLDHLFHSDDFRLKRLSVLPDFGSDHLPLVVELSYEPAAERTQEAPKPTADDKEAAEDALDDAAVPERER